MTPREEFAGMTDEILRLEERRANDQAAKLQSRASRMRQELRRRKKCDNAGRLHLAQYLSGDNVRGTR